ncbi:LuxR C-terminal-related transcriptional regulator [Streptomyces sp. ITFR-6]|uniref:helix-turn-helix transcriptional regulator n=1 Tax=Streptomyces sp. ITFR-6 TaxID=3075197 RepID=UPI00288AF385|nr:LuxR C-terminal-related transcriptional regulator [Streptomyces sp. ITFR-6]WNI30821.1 LuxR C-terminal-related transcriptional regulator [Streptomyces sp. ITFR-6]
MGGDEDTPAHAHEDRALCDTAVDIYTEALSAGRIPRTAIEPAPCLTELALVHPDPQDEAWVRPVPPSAALAHLLQPVVREIHERLSLSAALADSLAPLTTVASTDPNLAITVLEGLPLIDAAVQNATESATEEIRTLQPGSTRPPDQLQRALSRARLTLERGTPLRHIYQHPVRRAFIPANAARDVALEIRHPALVRYLIQMYEVLWAQAIPLTEPLPAAPAGTSVTAVQLSVARLLVEGHTDQVVAGKLGISVRTCRAHVSKLMQTLNATSRTQLGALLVRSGIAGTRPGQREGPPPRASGTTGLGEC